MMLNDLYGQSGFPCNPETFFGLDVDHNIIEYHLNSGVATAVDTILYSIPGSSLAFCNNINGGTFSPTFYTNSSSIIYYFSDTSWFSDTLPPSSMSSGGMGGNNNSLYLVKPELVIYSAGGILTQVSGVNTSAADVAVDDDGNAWYLTGTSSLQANKVRVLSPTGIVMKEYPISLNTQHAYGIFLLNSVLYIGFGSTNLAHPYSLLPITFNGNNAIIGTEIAMPHLSTYDLASCSPGNPLTMEENTANNYFSFYPNPVFDLVMLSFKTLNNTIRIYNSNGELILQFASADYNSKIHLGEFAAGFYFIECVNSRGLFRKKLLKL